MPQHIDAIRDFIRQNILDFQARSESMQAGTEEWHNVGRSALGRTYSTACASVIHDPRLAHLQLKLETLYDRHNALINEAMSQADCDSITSLPSCVPFMDAYTELVNIVGHDPPQTADDREEGDTTTNPTGDSGGVDLADTEDRTATATDNDADSTDDEWSDCMEVSVLIRKLNVSQATYYRHIKNGVYTVRKKPHTNKCQIRLNDLDEETKNRIIG